MYWQKEQKKRYVYNTSIETFKVNNSKLTFHIYIYFFTCEGIEQDVLTALYHIKLMIDTF